MPDLPPRNRAERRRAARQPATPGSRSRQRQTTLNLSMPPLQGTGTGGDAAAAAAGDADVPFPGDDSPGDGLGPLDDLPPADQQVFSGYKGKYGALKTGIVSMYGFAGLAVSRADQYDGMLITANAETVADSWIAWGKADPRVMRVLMVMFGSPVALVIAAHTPIVLGIMNHHGVSPMRLFSPVGSPRQSAPKAASPAAQPAQPAPLPYVPLGANAPTEAAPAPLPAMTADSELMVFPDEGIPAELDVALRQAARESGRPYQELRQEALLQIAQIRMAQNGRHGSSQTPPALGVPVGLE